MSNWLNAGLPARLPAVCRAGQIIPRYQPELDYNYHEVADLNDPSRQGDGTDANKTFISPFKC
jgi:hypothetical protein